jgi:hypothetical protein
MQKKIHDTRINQKIVFSALTFEIGFQNQQ